MGFGILVGFIINEAGWSGSVIPWIKPIGTIFIRLITMVAVPLVLASLIVGVASLRDLSKLRRIGTKTFLLYTTTTALAVSIGLMVGNILQPGSGLDESMKERLNSQYSSVVSEKMKGTSLNFTDMLVEIVPLNPFYSLATERGEMLQVVFFALILGLALNRIDDRLAEPVIRFFDGLTHALIRVIDMIMKVAPIGVFALIAAVIADFGFDILKPLGVYFVTVTTGLGLHVLLVYLPILVLFSKIPLFFFIRKFVKVQLVAFSSSSSAAALPVNMEVCEKELGVKKEVTSFVLPLGATINMDGTALYQGVAALFIAQVYGIDLGLSEQMVIILTATLASIGTAAVPGVGMIMLIIVLQSVHVPPEGIALIFGIDRILDMMRTTVNVTGDGVVASVVASTENLLDQTENGSSKNA
ncbi:MAG: dicarboxylate/amino acid:cation symporter [Bacteroidetes bacterium]|nr:dicarboxylate/amino acid:cation symporter [Bacteroidota bacterium]